MVLWVVTGGDAYDGEPLVEVGWERQGVPVGGSVAWSESLLWRGVSTSAVGV